MKNRKSYSHVLIRSSLGDKYKFTRKETVNIFNKSMVDAYIEFIEYSAEKHHVKLNDDFKKGLSSIKNSLSKSKKSVGIMTNIIGNSIILNHCTLKQPESYKDALLYLSTLALNIAPITCQGSNCTNEDYDTLSTFLSFCNFMHELKCYFLAQSIESIIVAGDIEKEIRSVANSCEELILKEKGVTPQLKQHQIENFNKEVNKVLNGVADMLHSKIKNDHSLLNKILGHIGDPVLNLGITTANSLLLSVAIYMRVANGRNDVPLASGIAKGTTTAGMIILFNNMIFHTVTLNNERLFEFSRSFTLLNLMQPNKEMVEKYNELLIAYKRHNRKKFAGYSVMLFFCEFLIRGCAINLPFNCTNIPNDPAALVGIAVFTGSAILPINGFFEFLSAKAMLSMNREFKEFTNCILSFTQEELITKDTETLYTHTMQMLSDKKNRKKAEQRYYCLAFILALLGSAIPAFIMINNALTNDVNGIDTFPINKTLFTNTTALQNNTIYAHETVAERNFAEKLYYNQSTISIIVNGIISLISRTTSTAAINHKFIQKSSERKIIKLNFFRYCCAFVALLMIALVGSSPGVPDVANVMVSVGAIACALIQNNVKDDHKFEFTNARIEELKNHIKDTENDEEVPIMQMI